MRKKVALMPEAVYRSIYSNVPRLTVDIVLEAYEGIVLVKRDIIPCLGYWILPGGTVLLGENLNQAVLRVAKDETGLDVKVVRRLGVLEYSRRAAFGQVIAIVYLARRVFGDLRGNRWGREVKTFKKLPKTMIAVQRKFLKSDYVLSS